MDALREVARLEGVRAAEPGVVAFNQAFLSTLRSGGRLHELGMTIAYKLRSRDLLGDIRLGLGLLLHGKLKLLPPRSASRMRVAGIIRRVSESERDAGHSAPEVGSK
jgi:hypothetical protein